MRSILHNPVYHALLTGDAHMSCGSSTVKYFDEAVSPFAGFDEEYDKGFDELHQLLPPGRKILFASRQKITEPPGWQQLVHIPGLQFVFDLSSSELIQPLVQPVPLGKENVEEMVQLAALTKPGPFGTRTIEFGNYHGIFKNGRLASMTGERLHPEGFAEISAVCTHPDFLGNGYAAALLQHQLSLICGKGLVPFLHVREDNDRAIALYERLGFKENGPMNFYFLKRKNGL